MWSYLQQSHLEDSSSTLQWMNDHSCQYTSEAVLTRLTSVLRHKSLQSRPSHGERSGDRGLKQISTTEQVSRTNYVHVGQA